jgi:hypothetical protein
MQGWVVLFLFLSGLPALLAAIFPPPGWRFLGGIASPDDVTQYLAAMYQGAQGRWLYTPPFDPTPLSPLVMYTPYIALGHMLNLLPGGAVFLYHVARLLCGVLVLFTAWKWSTVLFERKEARLTAVLLVSFSSGLGWLLAAVPSEAWQARLVDLRLPEANTFLAVFAAPHFALGIAFEALALFALWRGMANQRHWALWATLGGLALFGQALSYPFTLPVAYLAMGGCVLWLLQQGGRRRGWRALRVALIGGGIPLPFVLYYLNVFFFDPVWHTTHVAQSVMPTPGLGWLLAGYGIPLALAVWGGLEVWRARSIDSPWPPVVVWALVNAPMLYLPVTFQWRLANGWHFALALLAAHGMVHGVIPWLRERGTLRALRRVSPRPVDTLRRVLLILSLPSTLMVVLLGTRIVLTERDFPYYVPQEELQAMDELAGEVSFDDVVLGAYPTGNVLPSRALCRVVVGQQFATLDPHGKLEEVARFFDAGTSDEQRRAILERYGVTVVYHGRWEREMGAFDPGSASYLRELSRTEETVIYRVADE